MPNEKLLSCPFCRSNKVKIVYYMPGEQGYFTGRYAVQCEYTGEAEGCGAEGMRSKIRDEAIEAWNTRTPSPDLIELRKDKERLDWIDNNPYCFNELKRQAWVGFLIREAIDAAMKENNPQKLS